MKSGYPPIIKVQNRLAYYEALDKAHTTKIYDDFIRLISSEAEDSLDLYLNVHKAQKAFPQKKRRLFLFTPLGEAMHGSSSFSGSTGAVLLYFLSYSLKQTYPFIIIKRERRNRRRASLLKYYPNGNNGQNDKQPQEKC